MAGIARFMAQPNKPFTEGAFIGIHLIQGSSLLDTTQEAPAKIQTSGLPGTRALITKRRASEEKGKTNWSP